jgi:hypothetical protein
VGRYTVWATINRSEFTVIPGEGPPSFANGVSMFVDEPAELVWTIEAGSWEEAMQKFHVLQEWEPYRPMECEDK